LIGSLLIDSLLASGLPADDILADNLLTKSLLASGILLTSRFHLLKLISEFYRPWPESRALTQASRAHSTAEEKISSVSVNNLLVDDLPINNLLVDRLPAIYSYPQFTGHPSGQKASLF